MGQVFSSSPYSPIGGRSTLGNRMPLSYNPSYEPNYPNYPGGYHRGIVQGPPVSDVLPNLTDEQHMGPGPMQKIHPAMRHSGGYPGYFNPIRVRAPSNMYHSMGPIDRMPRGPMNMGTHRKNGYGRTH